MKKRMLALLLAGVMALGLAACGDGGQGESQAPDTTSTTPADSNESTPADSTGSAVSEIKVGAIMLHAENSGYDMAHIEGLTTACENLGIDMSQVTIRYNIPEDENCYDAAADLADAGCDIIFSDSYGHQTYMMQAALEFPDVTFVSCTGDQAGASQQPNLKNIFPYTYESRYVSGVVAGMKLKELMDAGTVTDPKIGYVGAYPYAEVVSGYTAFLLGIQSIVPEAYMEVQYTNSWYDLTKENETALALMNDGCVIIGQHADSTGAPSAVQAEHENGKTVFSVGYNIDMLAVAPDVALTSAQNVWSVLYQATLEAYLEGGNDAVPADYACGAAEGAQTISALGPACAEGTAEKVEEVWAALADGSLKVFDTSKFTVDGATVDSYQVDLSITDFASGEVIYQGQVVDAISDGAFQESVYRSAPYFDLRIDGITELN